MVADIFTQHKNLSEGHHNSKCKDCKSCPEYIKVRDKLLLFKCLKCNKNNKKYFNKDYVKRSANVYIFGDGGINKSCFTI